MAGSPPAAPVPRFTVIVPALNEEESLGLTVETVLREFDAVGLPVEVLVFDDASTDRTGEIADEWAGRDRRVRAFHNRRRLNIGGIYKAGIREGGGDYMLLVPGDNEVNIADIARGARHAGTADMVIFYVTNASSARSAFRVLLSRMYVWCVNALFNTHFRYTNGTNILRASLLRQVPIVTDGFAYQTEVLVKASRLGADFVDVGIRIQPRGGGRSKALSWSNLKLVATGLGRLWLEVMVRQRARYCRPGHRVGTY